MSKTLEFKAFCFEAYRIAKKLSGRETMMIFKPDNNAGISNVSPG